MEALQETCYKAYRKFMVATRDLPAFDAPLRALLTAFDVYVAARSAEALPALVDGRAPAATIGSAELGAVCEQLDTLEQLAARAGIAGIWPPECGDRADNAALENWLVHLARGIYTHRAG